MSTKVAGNHMIFYDAEDTNKMDVVRVPEGYSFQMDPPVGMEDFGYSSVIVSTGDVSALINFLLGGENGNSNKERDIGLPSSNGG
jgi:hypothetical protein